MMTIRSTLSRFVRGASGRVRAAWRGLLPFTVGFGVQLVAVSVIVAALTATLDTDALGSTAVDVLDLALLGVVSAIGLAVAVALARRLDRRSLADYGIARSRRDLADFAAGTVVGGLTYAVPTVVLLGAGGAAVSDRFVSPVGDTGATALLAGLAVVVFLAQVSFEEFAFRGAMLGNFAEGLAARGVDARRAVGLALAASSVCFGVMHVIRSGGGGVAGRSVEIVVASALNGLLWGGAYALTGRLSIATGLHFGHNLWAAIVVQPASVEMALPAVATITYDASLLSLAVGKVLVGAVCLFAWLSLTRDTVGLDAQLARWTADSTDRRGEAPPQAPTADD